MFRRVFAIGTLAVVVGLAAILFSAWGGFDGVRANPPGAPAGKLAFKFNYHALPVGTDPTCGNGAKVYTEIGAAGHIVWQLDTSTTGFNIVDCKTESLDGDFAWITGDAANTYSIYVVLLGKNSSTNSLDICRDIIVDFSDVTPTNLCLLGSVSLARGGGTDRFTFPKKLFADGALGELWTLQPGTDFRIAQVRLYQDP